MASWDLNLIRWLGGNVGFVTRLRCEGYGDPDLKGAPVGTSGGVSVRPFRLEHPSSDALRKWEIWSLDVQGACLQGGRSQRDVFLRAPVEWDPGGARRIWKLPGAVYGRMMCREPFIARCDVIFRAVRIRWRQWP